MADTEAEEEGAKAVEQTPEELPRVPCHLFLPVVPAARVIGKRGANIKEIREKSGAMVKILQKELPQEMQRREDRVAAISGEPTAVREAILGVLERVFDRSGLPDTADAPVRDRGYIVEVLVPEKCGSHLIGQKGERVKTLCQETKCDIRVGQDPVCGLEQKKVRISASNIQEASAAVWRILEVLGELVSGGVLKVPEHFDLRESGGFSAGAGASLFSAPRPARDRDKKEVPVRLLIAKEDAAWIVGKRGNKIARLRDHAKSNMGELSTADTASNTDASIARDVLFFLGRKPMPELIQYSEEELRNSAISDLESRCSTPVSSIQSLSTDEVAYALLVESILSRDPTGHSGLTAMSIEDQRNTLIVANNQRLQNKSIAELQALNSYQNSRLAYDWLLPALASHLIDSIGNLSLGTATFQASALNNISSPPSTVGMDVACIRFHDRLKKWIAVFHKQQPPDDLFDLYVAVGESPNSLEVTAVLRTQASMGQFYFLGDGVLLLYEQNNCSGPSVAASYYERVEDFLSGQSDPKTFVSQQTLGGSAEGTPSLTVVDETADELTIGMHCYISKGDTKVDQQAVAVLRGFLRGSSKDWQWQAQLLKVVNDWLPEDGVTGKLGSRSSFYWAKARWFIMEAQGELDNWYTWRIFLGDGLGFVKVPIRMASNSTANPVFTTFMNSSERVAVNMGDADAPPFDPEERFLDISAASLEERLKVVQLVLEDLTSRAEADSQKLRLLVPTELFGSVMGHRGETLRNIIQTSRAQAPRGRIKESDLDRSPLPIQPTEMLRRSLSWDPCEIEDECKVEELLDLLQDAKLTPFTLFCISVTPTPWEEAREIEALKLVFGMLSQLRNQPEVPPLPPLPSKLGVRRPSTLGAIGSNMPLKIPTDIEIPSFADRSFTFPTDHTTDHVDNVEHVGPAAFDQLDYRDLLRSLTLGSTGYGETVRSISFDMPAGGGYGHIPPAPRLHRFHVRGKAETFAEDGRSFTKKQKGRLSLVSEDRVHKKGVERYQVSFLSGELSRADGVGIIFSSHLPKNSDIQQIVSVFLNRTGRLCSRVNQRVIRIASTLPQIELGDVIEVENDIDMRCATFTIWSASGAAPATTVVSYVQVAEQLTATPGQSIPGHLAVVAPSLHLVILFLGPPKPRIENSQRLLSRVFCVILECWLGLGVSPPYAGRSMHLVWSFQRV
ncbi:PEP [Symbiodinium sp. CCMP2456]|nr:PEP [Symbiodinium sp. CCMP2456]